MRPDRQVRRRGYVPLAASAAVHSTEPVVRSLAARMLLTLITVEIVTASISWLTASFIGPRLFLNLLIESGGQLPESAVHHAQDAFRAANLLALLIGFAAAVLIGLVLSLVVARRIGHSAAGLSNAAAEVAAGHFDARVTAPSFGRELNALAHAFNTMAEQLQSVETTRRRLLADVGHEIRTPLAIIDGYLEGMQDGVVSADAATLATLRTQAARLARLADDINAVSQAEEGQLALRLELREPAELVTGAVGAAAKSFADRGVALHSDIDPDLDHVRVDPDRVGQVITNLLANALRHTPPGGHVLLSAQHGPRGEVGIVVRDSGSGIGADHLPHVFERFYQADTAGNRDHPGSGIGLAISKAIIDSHGGRIRAESPGPGQGATFTITLPPAGDTGLESSPAVRRRQDPGTTFTESS